MATTVYPSPWQNPGPDVYPGVVPVPPVIPPVEAPGPPEQPRLPTLSRWTFAIGPADGGLDRVLSTARARKVTFKLNASAEASCEIDGRHEAALWIQELATDLHVFRAPAPGAPAQRLFRGRIGKSGDELDGTSHTVQVPALDYRAVLARRRLMSGSQVTYAGMDLGAIAMALITQAQNKPGGSYGITPRGSTTVGVTADRTFKLGDAITDKIQELSEQEQGFDWDITPVDDFALVFDIWPGERGTDRGVILEWGAGGPIEKLSREVDSSTFANAVRLNGTAAEGTQTEPAIQERLAADIANAPEGRWDGVYGEQIVTTPALSARADWRIAESQIVQPTYSVTLKRGFWRGPDHIFLGDPVRLIVYSGRLRVDTTLRVQEIPIAISEEGTEQVQLKLGPARPDYKQRAVDIANRLLDLERS